MTVTSFPLGLTVHYIMALSPLLNKSSLWSKGIVAYRLTGFLTLWQLVCFTAKKIWKRKIIWFRKAKELKETGVPIADFQREKALCFDLFCDRLASATPGLVLAQRVQLCTAFGVRGTPPPHRMFVLDWGGWRTQLLFFYFFSSVVSSLWYPRQIIWFVTVFKSVFLACSADAQEVHHMLTSVPSNEVDDFIDFICSNRYNFPEQSGRLHHQVWSSLARALFMLLQLLALEILLSRNTARVSRVKIKCLVNSAIFFLHLHCCICIQRFLLWLRGSSHFPQTYGSFA